MNHKFKVFFTAATVAGLWLSAPGTLKAQVTLEVSISGTVFTQGDTLDNGITTKAPTKSSITTASILKQLALDEKAAGYWGSNTFPAGANLVYIAGPENPFDAFLDYPINLPIPGFQVVDKHNNLLVVVTNILSLDNSGQNGVYSGEWSQTHVQLASLIYDATSVGGTNAFTVVGLGTFTGKSTNPTTYGYTETEKFSFQNGLGQGVNSDGVHIIMTGVTITESGSATFINGAALVGGFGFSGGLPPPPPPPPPVYSLP